MRFDWPFMLLLLLIVPAALLGYVLASRQRARYAVSFSNLAVLASVVETAPRWRRVVPAAFAMLALAAALAAVARPQVPMSVAEEQASVVLTVDISGSMRADDVKPTRLDAAKASIRNFLDKLPDQYRVGLVTFSSEAYIAAPLTDDRELVLTALDYAYPLRGTAIGDALASSVALVAPVATGGDSPPRAPAVPPLAGSDPERPLSVILMLSDGAQTEGRLEPREGALRAKSYGIPIYTIALGTPDGIVPGRFGQAPRPVPPDPQTLAEIAEVTGGEAFKTTNEAQLNSVYEDIASRLGRHREWREATSFFLGGAALFALMGGLLSLLWGQRLP